MKNIFVIISRIIPVLILGFFLMPGNAEAAAKWYYEGVSMEGPPIPYNLCTNYGLPSDPSGLACTVGTIPNNHCKTPIPTPVGWPVGMWYDIYICEEQTGTINVTSNIPTSWWLSGPSSILQTSLLLTGTHAPVPTGSYTINWGSRPGYTTPPPETKILLNGGNITFNANYAATPTCTTVYIGGSALCLTYSLDKTEYLPGETMTVSGRVDPVSIVGTPSILRFVAAPTSLSPGSYMINNTTNPATDFSVVRQTTMTAPASSGAQTAYFTVYFQTSSGSGSAGVTLPYTVKTVLSCPAATVSISSTGGNCPNPINIPVLQSVASWASAGSNSYTANCTYPSAGSTPTCQWACINGTREGRSVYASATCPADTATPSVNLNFLP